MYKKEVLSLPKEAVKKGASQMAYENAHERIRLNKTTS